LTEIKIIRRVALDKPYEYYEFHATYDPAKEQGNKVIQDIERQVAFARAQTATEEPEQPQKTPKISTKKKEVPEPTEDIKIADLQTGDKVNINVTLVKPIDPEKDIKAFINKTDGSAGKRCKVIVQDDSGKIQLTLFDEQIDLVQSMKENAWLSIQNGYVKDWKGTLEMVVGQYGTMEVMYNGPNQ